MSSVTSLDFVAARTHVIKVQAEGKIHALEQSDPAVAKIVKTLNLSMLFELLGKEQGSIALDSAALVDLHAQLKATEQNYLQKLNGRAESSVSPEELTDLVVGEMNSLVEKTLPECLKRAQENTKIAPVNVKGHFYKISDANGKILGHLLGTTHVIDHSLFPLNEPINRVIASAKRVFFEIKELDQIEKLSEPSFDLAIGKLSPEHLSKLTRNYLNQLKELTVRNLSWQQLQEKVTKLPPAVAFKLCLRQYLFLVSLTIENFDEEGQIIQGIDDLVFYKCRRLKTPIFGLESIEDHFKLCPVPDLPEPRVEDYQTYAAAQSIEWAAGKDYKDTLITKDPTSPNYAIAEKRSVAFSRKIAEDLIQKGDGGLYVFGLSHLYDGKSVIHDLIARGFRIERS